MWSCFEKFIGIPAFFKRVFSFWCSLNSNERMLIVWKKTGEIFLMKFKLCKQDGRSAIEEKGGVPSAVNNFVRVSFGESIAARI